MSDTPNDQLVFINSDDWGLINDEVYGARASAGECAKTGGCPNWCLIDLHPDDFHPVPTPSG